MQKIQVLLPEPVLRDLREIASAEDRSLSEVLRRAASKGRALDAPGAHTSAEHPRPFF